MGSLGCQTNISTCPLLVSLSSPFSAAPCAPLPLTPTLSPVKSLDPSPPLSATLCPPTAASVLFPSRDSPRMSTRTASSIPSVRLLPLLPPMPPLPLSLPATSLLALLSPLPPAPLSSSLSLPPSSRPSRPLLSRPSLPLSPPTPSTPLSTLLPPP